MSPSDFSGRIIILTRQIFRHGSSLGKRTGNTGNEKPAELNDKKILDFARYISILRTNAYAQSAHTRCMKTGTMIRGNDDPHLRASQRHGGIEPDLCGVVGVAGDNPATTVLVAPAFTSVVTS